MDLPETVKWTEEHGFFGVGAGAIAGYPFDIKIGPKEVMILMGLHYWWYGTLQIGDNVAHLGLWRKTDSDPSATVWSSGAFQDMMWHRVTCISEGAAGESVVSGDAAEITFPYPIVLIRSPRALIEVQTVINVAWSMRLYYLLREVSNEELAKLMVKDHA